MDRLLFRELHLGLDRHQRLRSDDVSSPDPLLRCHCTEADFPLFFLCDLQARKSVGPSKSRRLVSSLTRLISTDSRGELHQPHKIPMQYGADCSCFVLSHQLRRSQSRSQRCRIIQDFAFRGRRRLRLEARDLQLLEPSFRILQRLQACRSELRFPRLRSTSRVSSTRLSLGGSRACKEACSSNEVRS